MSSRTPSVTGKRALPSSSHFEARTVPLVAALESIEPRPVTEDTAMLEVTDDDPRTHADFVSDAPEFERRLARSGQLVLVLARNEQGARELIGLGLVCGRRVNAGPDLVEVHRVGSVKHEVCGFVEEREPQVIIRAMT